MQQQPYSLALRNRRQRAKETQTSLDLNGPKSVKTQDIVLTKVDTILYEDLVLQRLQSFC